MAENQSKTLNPSSSAFLPSRTASADACNTVETLALPDLSALSLDVRRPAPSLSTPSAQISSLSEEDVTPTRRKEAHTPPSFFTSTPQFSFNPFTPGTAHTSSTRGDSLPVTPHTPAHLKALQLPSSAAHAQGQGRPLKSSLRSQEAFGSTEETADGVGRYLLITDFPPATTSVEVRDLIGRIAECKLIIVKHLKNKGHIFVVFYDAREALKVYLKLHTGPVTLRKDGEPVLLHCFKTDKQMITSSMSPSEQTQYDGEASQTTIQIRVHGGYPVTADVIKGCLSNVGEVKRVAEIGGQGRCFVAEYHDTRHAENAITLLDQASAGQATLSVSYVTATRPAIAGRPPSFPSAPYTLGSAVHTPGQAAFGHRLSVAQSPSPSDPFGRGSSIDSNWSGQQRHGSQATLARLRGDSDVVTPNTSPSLGSNSRGPSIAGSRLSSEYAWNQDEYPSQRASLEMIALDRRLAEPGTVQGLVNKADISARARQGQGLGGVYHANDPKAIPVRNRVFPDRILSGLDGRTTVMIKDVPNKLSREELIGILADVVPGEFDFVYLRFDFKNCCNVGYAFVNFCSVKALYQFICAKVGQKWNLFSSEKVLQVSYADIQGKAALINKFRNSAVMGVIEAWRPQLFYSSGAMKGQPEPFPTPDNLAIRQKSAAAQLSGFTSTPSSYIYDDNQPYDYSGTYNATYGF